MYKRVNLLGATIVLLLVSFSILSTYYLIGYLSYIAIMSILWLYFMGKLGVNYFNHFYDTKLERVNTKTKFLDDKVQRFRVFFYAFFSPLAIVIFLLFTRIQVIHDWYEPLYTSLLFIAFLWCMLFLNFTWSDTFFNNCTPNRSFVPRKQFYSTFKLKDLSPLELKEINSEFHQYFDNYQDITNEWGKNNGNLDKFNCIHKEKNKMVGYKKIFELLDKVIEDGILDLFDNERTKLYNFIIQNFTRNGEIIDKDNLNAAYCKWRKNNG
ncbi:hypothetical protein VSO93_13470 [Myroides odoratimimus]|nr:hypothetical protein [Myroides odoratimimus]